MNQTFCPQTVALIDHAVQSCLRRGRLHLFDPEDLRQELYLHVLQARRSYRGPATRWLNTCRHILRQSLRRIRSLHSPHCPQNQNLPLDSLAERDIPLDDTLHHILGRMQNFKYCSKWFRAGQALLQAAQDARVGELIAQLPANDQIFGLLLASLSKDEILQETGLSRNTYSYRLRRVAAILKAEFPELARGRRHRRGNPHAVAAQTTPGQQSPNPAQPEAAPTPPSDSLPNTQQASEPAQNPTARKQNPTEQPSAQPERPEQQQKPAQTRPVKTQQTFSPPLGPRRDFHNGSRRRPQLRAKRSQRRQKPRAPPLKKTKPEALRRVRRQMTDGSQKPKRGPQRSRPPPRGLNHQNDRAKNPNRRCPKVE